MVSPGVGAGVSRDPRDMAKAGLPDSQSPDDANPSVGKTLVTDTTLCDGFLRWLSQPSGCGALPSEGNQGDGWDAYVMLGRATGTNAGSTFGARVPR